MVSYSRIPGTRTDYGRFGRFGKLSEIGDSHLLDSGDTNRLWMIRYYMKQVWLSGVEETARQHVSQNANIGSCPRNPA